MADVGERMSVAREESVVEAGRRRRRCVLEPAWACLRQNGAVPQHQASGTFADHVQAATERYRTTKHDGDGVGIDMAGDGTRGESAVGEATRAVQAPVDEQVTGSSGADFIGSGGSGVGHEDMR